MRLSSGPTHQSISGRCWTRAYFRDGSIATELSFCIDVEFASDSDRRARSPFGSFVPEAVHGWRPHG